MNIGADMQYQITQLIRDMGGQAVLRREAKGEYQLGTGSTGGDGTPADQAVTVVLTERSSSFAQMVAQSARSSGIVARGRIALISGMDPDGCDLGRVPETGDLLVGTDVQVMLTSVQRINVSGVDVGWVAEVKSA